MSAHRARSYSMDGVDAEDVEHLPEEDGAVTEVLVHNVSHNDMLMAFQPDSSKVLNAPNFLRPKFSDFDRSSTAALAAAKAGSSIVVHHTDKRRPCAVGLCFAQPYDGGSWDQYHVRDKTYSLEGKPSISAVLFPLLCLIIPAWRYITKPVRMTTRKRYQLLLVSGSGTPRNPIHDTSGNSTHATAKLLSYFIETVYPDIQVKILNAPGIFRYAALWPNSFPLLLGLVSHYCAFASLLLPCSSMICCLMCYDLLVLFLCNFCRYDQNITFVRRFLRPVIDTLRRRLANVHGEHWSKYLNLTLSLTDGAPARVAAISASLRSYRPNYLHMFELKSLWYEGRVSEVDLDYHLFETIDTRPPAGVADVSPDVSGYP